MKNITTMRSELLMPAGNLQKLKVAILYGADAVYLGTPDMSLRSKSEFSLEDVVEGIDYAHEHGKRVYLTLNLFSHNSDIPKLDQYIDTVRKVKPDGLIIADPGVFQYVKERAPELELHISTQANVCSWLSVKFWESQGASLCVMAREVSFEELAEIREKCPDIKLEAFVHGSMCMTYSGRCLLSNFMSERGSNQGSCSNSCRWHYKLHMRLKDGTIKELEITDENADLFEFLLEEEHRPGEFMPFEEDVNGSYILNSKDLCLMPKLDDYLSIGVDSLKVEGRNKSIYYVAVVARAYRMAMDAWARDPENWKAEPFMEELDSVQNRGYTLAFHDGRLTNLAHNYDNGQMLSEWEFAGIITDITEDAFIVDVRNMLVAGDVLEFMPVGGHEGIFLRIYEFESVKNGKITTEIHGGQKPLIRVPFAWFEHENVEVLKAQLPIYSVLRKERALTKYQFSRLKLDHLTQRLEVKGGSDEAYFRKRDQLQEAIKEHADDRPMPRTPRTGTEGCCGRGCNGCLIFWKDPTYAKARELLAKKKQGELLDNAEKIASVG